MKIVIITYQSGKIIAMRKDDKELLETLIADHNYIEDIEVADFIAPEKWKNTNKVFIHVYAEHIKH